MTTKKKAPITIGVAGGTGSGKTTVAKQLLSKIGHKHIAHISHDSYYYELSQLSSEERSRINFDHPDALDTPLLIEHLKQLQKGQSAHIPVYDFTTDSRKPETIVVGPQPIILVEGILIYAEPELRELLDIKIFVDTDADIRFIRRLQRDIEERGRSPESVISQYLETVRPMHQKFVEPSKRYADIIIPQGGYNFVAIDMIADRLKNMMQELRSSIEENSKAPSTEDDA
ncbi:uridine kinase [Anaerolineales bacterium]